MGPTADKCEWGKEEKPKGASAGTAAAVGRCGGSVGKSWDTRSLEHGGSQSPLESFWKRLVRFLHSGSPTPGYVVWFPMASLTTAQGQIMLPSQEPSHSCHGGSRGHWSTQNMERLAGIRQ